MQQLKPGHWKMKNQEFRDSAPLPPRRLQEADMTKRPPRYQAAASQKLYDQMLRAAANKSSELYVKGIPQRDTADHAAFWDGYSGKFTLVGRGRSTYVIPGTSSAVCFAAGRTFAKTNPGTVSDDAASTVGQRSHARSKV